MESTMKIGIKGKGKVTKGMDSNGDVNIIEDQIVECSDRKTRQLSKVRPDLIGRKDVIDNYFEFEIEEEFENDYIDIIGYDFGHAIRAMKEGKFVARKGWNGKGMYLWLLPATEVKKEWVKDPILLQVFGDRDTLPCLGSIRMHTATGEVLTGWLASQTDILAEDWVVLN